MNVEKVKYQGYCFGVVRAIKIAKNAAENEPKPIYILGDIVHNKLVSQSLQSKDLITIESKDKSRLDLLDEIDHGTVIFTAHGVSPEVRKKAKEKGLNMIDATCPEVMETQDEIAKFSQMDYKIIFVGKKNHPEAEACISIDRENTIFISTAEDIDKIKLENRKYFITYQSTLNTDDVQIISEKIEELLKDHIYTNRLSVCNATQIRQNAIKDLKNVDLLIVVGDSTSNNSNKLVEISKHHAHIDAIRILSINELNLEILKDVQDLAVTSGASTPPQLTKHIIEFLKQFSYNDKNTWNYEEFDIREIQR